MRNKSIIYFTLLIAVTLVTSSCNEWLEATSSSQVSDKKMYASRNGFHEALTGVYLAMAAEDVYGANYTWRCNDIICVPYASMSRTFYRVFQQHNYSVNDAQPYIDGMWQGGYHVIACANKALYELEQRRDVITDDLEYNLIKGELLAARAYVHFDMMRMFGEASWGGDNADKHTVPYVREYTSMPTFQATYSETAQLLLEDIKQALECLANDPVRGMIPEDFESTINSDGYWTDRQKHLNYYAVKALQARVSMWTGDYVQAYNSASEVISGALESGLAHWVDTEAFTHENDSDRKDWTFSCEHIFSLEVTNLYDNLKAYFFPETGKNEGLMLPEETINELYPNIPEVDHIDLLTDVRGPSQLLKYRAGGYVVNKFYSSNSYLYAFRCRMPMIRLSEMYIIQAKVNALSFNMEGCADCLDQIRFHRGLEVPMMGGTYPYLYHDLTPSQDIVSCLSAALNELFKETIGEGQFLYELKWTRGIIKSLNVWGYYTNILFLEDTDLSKLKYPYPLEETSFGRVQDE